ncbi:MAG: transglutaminase domain-containing protein [Thermosynechococcaceae cyanobacterium]
MKIPVASLCSLALGLWGFQTGFLLCAIPMIVMLESRHWIRRRWELKRADLKSLLNVCGMTLGLLFLVCLVTQGSFSIGHRLIQWLPICTFALVATQTYITNFSEVVRSHFSKPHRWQRVGGNPQKPLNLYTPYFALCLLSASATNWNGLAFYSVFALLAAILLWTLRPQQSQPLLWVALILLTSGLGFIGHLQLHQLQATVEEQTAPWLNGLTGDTVDPYRAMTQMGSIGSLKQSNRIVFRVAGDLANFPILLREATYNRYGASSWVATQSKFTPITSSEGQDWALMPSSPAASAAKIEISSPLNGGKDILNLPAGATTIRRLPVQTMTKNQYGTVKVEGSAGTITYGVEFDLSDSSDSPPTANDLQIPEAERPAIEQLLATLDLKGQSETQAVAALSDLFQHKFRYSLKFASAKEQATPLSAFLLETRSGHCEYFASATTLLLRGLGIPARYAVGYSVHDYSPLEQQYVVRSRNAHAWVMAYINGTWQTVDTTPPDWTTQEDATASPLQSLSDLWSFVFFQLSMGVSTLLKGDIRVWAGVAISPILFFLLWKGGRKLSLRLPQASTDRPAQVMPPIIGTDSAFYQIEQRLQMRSQRATSESLQHWILRLQLAPSQLRALQHILNLHYRYRFDPQGIDAAEREHLERLSQTWLKDFQAEP